MPAYRQWWQERRAIALAVARSELHRIGRDPVNASGHEWEIALMGVSWFLPVTDYVLLARGEEWERFQEAVTQWKEDQTP